MHLLSTKVVGGFQPAQKQREVRQRRATATLVCMSVFYLSAQWAENLLYKVAMQLRKQDLAAYHSAQYIIYMTTAVNSTANFLFYMMLPSMREAFSKLFTF